MMTQNEFAKQVLAWHPFETTFNGHTVARHQLTGLKDLFPSRANGKSPWIIENTRSSITLRGKKNSPVLSSRISINVVTGRVERDDMVRGPAVELVPAAVLASMDAKVATGTVVRHMRHTWAMKDFMHMLIGRPESNVGYSWMRRGEFFFGTKNYSNISAIVEAKSKRVDDHIDERMLPLVHIDWVKGEEGSRRGNIFHMTPRGNWVRPDIFRPKKTHRLSDTERAETQAIVGSLSMKDSRPLEFGKGLREQVIASLLAPPVSK